MAGTRHDRKQSQCLLASANGPLADRTREPDFALLDTKQYRIKSNYCRTTFLSTPLLIHEYEHNYVCYLLCLVFILNTGFVLCFID